MLGFFNFFACFTIICLALVLENGKSEVDYSMYDEDTLAFAGAAPNLPVSEITALHALYNATRGEHWCWYYTALNGIPWEFNATCNPCVDQWQGVHCSNVLSDGYLHVTQLELVAHNLSGTLPSTIAYLTHIRTLDLQLNHLTGTIPASIGLLQDTKHLGLAGNQLSGTIPPELSNLRGIDKLALFDNHLSGRIPAGLGNLQLMSLLLLYSNMLTGPLPEELCDLSPVYFTQLDLFDNMLTGSIPAEIGNLQALNFLSLYNNPLSGTLPPQLGTLTGLIDLYISNNYMTGRLPEELGALLQLQQLSLHNSYYTGSIPLSWGELTNLTYLALNTNMLTSTVPAGLNQMRYLESLALFNNKFSGPIAPLIDSGVQMALTFFQVNNNRFSGQIPADLFALPVLLVVVLGENCFTGSLPVAICSAPQLTTLSMDGLHSAPSCRHRLFPGTIMNAFVLTDHIQDGIPTCLFQMPKLNTLHLSGNGLLGSLPDNVSISANLVDLALSYNKLTGSIAAAFQERIWYNLDLSYNKLSGTLTDKMATVPGNMSVMARLGLTVVNGTSDEYNNPYGATKLRNNRLSNTIPSVLASMQNVSILRGNVFECALNQHDLPQHDSGRPTYSCGSDTFDVPYYVYVGMLLMAVCFCVVAFVYQRSWPTSLTSVNVRRALHTMAKWVSVVEQYEAAAASTQVLPLQKYKQVQLLFGRLCEKAAWCTLYIVVVGLPLYAILSHYYGTHTYTYAWTVSAAYLSGPTALALQLVFLCMLLVLLVTMYASLTQVAHHKAMDEVQTPLQGRISPTCSMALLQRWSMYAALFTANSVVVGGVNIGFVLAATNGDALAQAFAQIALSVFKLLWSNFGLIYLMRWTQQRLTVLDKQSEIAGTAGAAAHAFFGLQLFVQLYNLIIVPCVVTALLSPDCFNSAFVAAPTVTTHYTYIVCYLLSGQDDTCIQYTTVYDASNYDPPFTYSYQCSSSLITYYAPTFVYAGLIATFVNPVLSWAQRAVYVRVPEQSPWKPVVRLFVPKIQRPSGAAAVQFDKPYNPLRPYWDANHRCILLLTYLGVLLTFGLVFPPLALVMLTTMYSAVWLSRLEVGRFLSEALADNVHKYSEIIDAECEGVGSVPRHQAARVLLWVVCAFYAPFLFDTLGDAQGARRSYWVLIVTPLLPVVVLVLAHAVVLLPCASKDPAHCAPDDTKENFAVSLKAADFDTEVPVFNELIHQSPGPVNL